MSLLISKKNEPWFNKRGVVLLLAWLFVTYLTVVLACIQSIGTFGITQLSHGYHAFVSFLWWLGAIGGLNLILGRILLQVVNNLRSQMSDDQFYRKLSVPTSANTPVRDIVQTSTLPAKNKPSGLKTQARGHIGIDLNRFIIKYFYILGNPKFLLIILLLSWVIICTLACLTLFVGIDHTGHGHEFDLAESFTKRYVPFFCVVIAIMACKALFIGLIAKNLDKSGGVLNSWHIWSEMKIILSTFACACIAAICAMVIELIIVGHVRYAHIIAEGAGFIWVSFIWYISIHWVHNINSKLVKKPKIKSRNRVVIMTSAAYDNSTNINSGITVSSTSAPSSKTLTVAHGTGRNGSINYDSDVDIPNDVLFQADPERSCGGAKSPSGDEDSVSRTVSLREVIENQRGL